MRTTAKNARQVGNTMPARKARANIRNCYAGNFEIRQREMESDLTAAYSRRLPQIASLRHNNSNHFSLDGLLSGVSFDSATTRFVIFIGMDSLTKGNKPRDCNVRENRKEQINSRSMQKSINSNFANSILIVAS